MTSKHRYYIKRVRPKAFPLSSPTSTLCKEQKGLRQTVMQSPHINDDPGLAPTFNKWSSVSDQLESVHAQIVALLSQLVTLRAQEGMLRAQWFLSFSAFVALCRTVFVDNVAAWLSMGLHPASGPQGPHPVTAPLHLRAIAMKAQPGHQWLRWHAVLGAGLYELQRSPDPQSEASFVTVYMDRHCKFADVGVPGQVVWYRVRARGTGNSDWTVISYVIR